MPSPTSSLFGDSGNGSECFFDDFVKGPRDFENEPVGVLKRWCLRVEKSGLDSIFGQFYCFGFDLFSRQSERLKILDFGL